MVLRGKLRPFLAGGIHGIRDLAGQVQSPKLGTPLRIGHAGQCCLSEAPDLGWRILSNNLRTRPSTVYANNRISFPSSSHCHPVHCYPLIAACSPRIKLLFAKSSEPLSSMLVRHRFLVVNRAKVFRVSSPFRCSDFDINATAARRGGAVLWRRPALRFTRFHFVYLFFLDSGFWNVGFNGGVNPWVK